MSDQTNDRSLGRPMQVRRRLWWGHAGLGLLVVATVGAIVIEALTGRFSGAVMQVRIDECTPRKLRMTGFRITGSSGELRFKIVPQNTITVRVPETTAPLLTNLRTRFWKKMFGPLSLFNGLDQSASVAYIKTGDVFQLRRDETVTLMSWETDQSANRWAIIAHVDP